MNAKIRIIASINHLKFLLANLDDLSGLLQNSSQPVNIPGSQLSNSISGTVNNNNNKLMTNILVRIDY